MNKKKYPSSITWEQFAKIAPLLESAKNKTSPRTLDLYEAFNAVLYLLEKPDETIAGKKKLAS